MFPFLKLFIPIFCDLDKLSICCILYCDPLTIPFIIFYHSFKLHYSCARKRVFSRDVNLLRTTSIRTAVLRTFRDRVNCLLATSHIFKGKTCQKALLRGYFYQLWNSLKCFRSVQNISVFYIFPLS